MFLDRLEAGNPLGAIGDLIAAEVAPIPFAIAFVAVTPIVEAAGGTPLNLVDLIP